MLAGRALQVSNCKGQSKVFFFTDIFVVKLQVLSAVYHIYRVERLTPWLEQNYSKSQVIMFSVRLL